MTTATAGLPSGSGWSPFMRVQNQLQSAAKSGTVKAEDQDALSAALTDIGTQLQAGAAGSKGTPSAAGNVKSTVDNIISNDVSSGKLTSDQATELKSVLSQAAQKMHGHGGHHHGHGGGVSSTDPDSDDTTTDPITGTATTTASTSFASFIQQLETSLSDSISGATGTSLTTDATASTSATTGTTASSSSASSTTSSTDQRQLMLSFLQKLGTALGSNTYGSAGGSATNAQGVLVNAMA